MKSSVCLAICIALLSVMAATAPAQQKRADPVLRTVTWRCDKVELVATFLEGKPPTVQIELGDSAWTLPLVPSGSGSKYSDGSVTLWTHGNEATFESPDMMTPCVFVDPVASMPSGLEGPKWQLVSLVREGVGREVPSGVAVDATFKDGRVTGRGGCNRYFASYTIGENQALNVGDIGATKMACPDNVDIEDVYFASLSGSSRFAIAADTLTITTSSGSLTFTKAP